MGSDEWVGMREWRKEYRNWNWKSLKNGIEKYNLTNRTKWINSGTILVDDKYYFYCQKKKVRIKGTNIYHKVKSFKHFYDEFVKTNELGLNEM
jgi:hypothetical protein